MTLVRWDPYRHFLTLQREMNRLFEPFVRGEGTSGSPTWTPPADIFERDDDVVVAFELPGVDPKRVELKVEGDHLTIRGERRPAGEVPPERFYARETCHGPFQRTFTMPPTVDREKIRADYAHGILRVTLPKAASAKPRQIPLLAA